MVERTLRFSDPWLKALKPEATPAEFRDSAQPGLVLRLEASGRRTFVCRYTHEGRRRRFTIGAYPDVKLKDAREEAQRKRGQSALGTDPQAAREAKRAADTVGEAIDAWLASAETRSWRLRTRESFMSHVKLRLRPELGSVRLQDLTRAHVLAMLDPMPGAVNRNRALTTARMLCRWLVWRGDLTTDPTAGIKRLPEEARGRTMTDDELRAFVRGFDRTRWRHYVRVLFLTGVRRDELLGARWDDIDRERGIWTIPPAAEKAGRARRGGPRKVMLSTVALRELAAQRERNMARGHGAAEWVFPTAAGNRPHRDAVKPTLNVLRGLRANGQKPSTDKRAPKREAVIPLDVDLHDARRTLADRLLNVQGVSAYVVDVGVLGHSKPALLGVYAPSAPLSETRAALEAWAVELARILGEPAPKRKDGRA